MHARSYDLEEAAGGGVVCGSVRGPLGARRQRQAGLHRAAVLFWSSSGMWFMLSDDGGNGAWILYNSPIPALLPL